MCVQLTQSYFAKTLETLCAEGFVSKIAVAVSGGADSLCLALMAHDWAVDRGIEVIGLTVDHGLRPESAAEAEQVHVWLTERKMAHHILTWTGDKPKTRVEEKAREARYRLLLDWCHHQKVSCLLLGHQLEDQAETFFLRLARSSGIDGLSAMRPVTIREGVFLVRPFLDVHRDSIRGYLRTHYRQKWIEDPSNQDDQYERVRLRKAAPILSQLGLTPQAVSLSAKRLARVRGCLETLTDSFLKKQVVWSHGGYAFIPSEAWENLPQEIALRVLSFVLETIGGGSVPRLEQLEKRCRPQMQAQTLAGCEIVPCRTGFYVCREWAQMAAPVRLKAETPTHWDRFYVCVSKAATIAPLQEALSQTGLPAKVRRTLPALYDGKTLLWVPSLDYYAKKDDINGTVVLKVSKWKKM